MAGLSFHPAMHGGLYDNMFSFTTHPWWRRWFGSRSERAAARFLRRFGYRILEHNFTCQFGEIDIVAVEDSTIVFVEVRSTESTDTTQAAQSVDTRKQQRLTRLALHYLQINQLLDCSARFDVLVMSWPADQKEPKIVHYPQAFEALGRFQMFS
jgi:putative endonuclease